MVDAYSADTKEYERGKMGMSRFILLPEIISVMSK